MAEPNGTPVAVTPDDIVDLTNKVNTAVGSWENSADQLKAIDARLATMDQKVDAGLQNTVVDMKKMRDALDANLGVSGRKDFESEFAKFLNAVYVHRRFRKAPEGVELNAIDEHGKAIVDFTADVDATAGYLVPDIMSTAVTPLLELFGFIYPRIPKAPIKQGTNLLINKDAVLPVAAYRLAQGDTIGEEETPASFGQTTLVPTLNGAYIKIANELLASATPSFASLMTMRLVKAVNKLTEDKFVAGTAASDAPHDGFLIETGPNDQTNFSANTLATWATFIEECVADYPACYNTLENFLFMHPGKHINLMSESVSSTNLPGALSWGDPRLGAPPTLYGYEILVSEAMLISTTYWNAMGNLGQCTMAETPSMAIDINALGGGWIHNESWLRVFTHNDWDLGILNSWSKADYT